MKIGIIIVFCNNERDICSSLLDGLLSIENHVQLCFINNGSEDATLDRLEEFKDTCKLDTVVIDIKKNRGVNNAVKAGARYLFNQNELKHIGYVNADKLSTIQDLYALIKIIETNKYSIIKYNLNTMKSSQIKRLIFKNVFCVLEYLDKLNIKLKPIKLYRLHN